MGTRLLQHSNKDKVGKSLTTIDDEKESQAAIPTCSVILA